MIDASMYSFFGLVGLVQVMILHRHLKPVRDLWPDLFGCSQCLGFHLGALTFACWIGREYPDGLVRLLHSILYGGSVSLVSYAVHTWLLKNDSP